MYLQDRDVKRENGMHEAVAVEWSKDRSPGVANVPAQQR
jgi:hypothetical protein